MNHRPPTPPRWQGQDSLGLVVKLNERALTLVREAVINSTTKWPVGVEHRTHWSAIDSKSLARAARLPFVILDAYFTDDAYWRMIADRPEEMLAKPVLEPVWPTPVAQQLLTELLVLGWHSARWNRDVARISLGMTDAVAERIAALTPQEIALIGARHPSALGLRWQEDPAFWTRLLVGAREADEPLLSDIHLHAKLMFSSGLISAMRG